MADTAKDRIEDTLSLFISIKTRFTERTKPREKEYFINDGGLYLFVGKNDTKIWKFIFTFEGKRKKLSFGIYPDATLENARRKAEEARRNIADGIDPSETRKQAKAEIAQVGEN